MKIRRVFSAFMIFAMAAGLTGCTFKTENKNTGSASGISKAENERVLKVAAAETSYGSEMWVEVCKGFEKLNPGVKTELTIDKKFEDVVTPKMKAGEFPDVIVRAVGTEAALAETFIRDNNIEELTDVLSMKVPGEEKTVEEKIIPGFLDNTIVKPYEDDKVYLMPIFYSPCGLFYNKTIFEDYGWEVPESWADMWALGDKAREKGISLFTYPTAGYFDTFFYSLLHEAMGREDFLKALRYSEGIWDTEGAKTVFNIIEKLTSYTEPTTPANANDNDYKQNQQLVLDGKALFMPNGNWVIDEMRDAPRTENFEWAMAPVPAVNTGGERAAYSYFEQVWIPKKAENKDLAKLFISYLYSDEAVKIFAESLAIQPVNNIEEVVEGAGKSFYSAYGKGATAVMDTFATTELVEGVTVRGTFFEPINSLVTGDETKAEWVENIKKDSDRLRAALKK